jgi:teichuronic acid biosynthesis glycosyltransferase TuaC
LGSAHLILPDLERGLSLKPDIIRLLTFSTLYPSSVRPGHGIFVETRLKELVSSGLVESCVIAPVPWFFSTHPRFKDYARMARTPRRETRNGFDVQHPQYALPPKVGMNTAPFTLAMGARRAIQRLLDEGYDFDVIDAHYYYPDGVAAALLARHFNKPFTITARGSDINLITKHEIPRRLMLWASRRAAASIGVSRALTQAMERMGMPADKLVTMPNGVDLNLFRMQPQTVARAELGWPHGPTLLSVGNLVENKGHHIAIEALAQLPDFRLVIAGEGPERHALEALAKNSQTASRIKFLGRVEQNQLAVCYSAADILVLPSSREGWPNVLLESMACGTPVVATRVGGIPEIVTSASAGRLMPEQNAASLVTAVADLWQQMPDPMSVRARAQQCGWQSTTDAQLRLFRGIASKALEEDHA